MAFDDILGQEHAVRILRQALVSTRLAHAYLFYGPDGVGKKYTALQFAKALYCLSSSREACDTCAACHKIATDNHPDVILIAPDETTIKIEQVRTMQRRLSYKPYEGQRLTVLIDGCEQLTLPAANALLKTLEEPAAESMLLLITANKEALPITLISRCQPVAFRPLTATHLCTLLTRQGVEAETAALAAPLAEGRLSSFFQDDFTQMLALRQSAYNALQSLVEAQDLDLFLRARQLAGKREQCDKLLHWFVLLCRDLTVLKVTSTVPIYNRDLQDDLTRLAERLPLASLLDTCELLHQLRMHLSANANPQLVFEHLVLQLQQIFADTGRL